GYSRIGVCVLDTHKRRERNTASEESTSKRVGQSDPNVISSQVLMTSCTLLVEFLI
nr:hypothetical protein [Tanacetum cinerariifolium]